jgi:hypothetical protein
MVAIRAFSRPSGYLLLKILVCRVTQEVFDVKTKKTWKQVETAKLRAENFVRNVQGDDERADEIADETKEEYAERKGFVIENPSRTATNKLGAKQMATKQEVEHELEQAYERIATLEEHIQNGAELLDDDDDDDSESDDDDEEDEILPSPPMVENGIFSDGARYVGGRVESRGARKAYDKAVANHAKAKAQLERAEQRYRATQ